MNRSLVTGPTFRLATVLAFVLASLVYAGYLYAQAGGSIPGITGNGSYTVYADVDNVENLVPFADVEIAGVPVGKVQTLTRLNGDKIRLEVVLQDVAAPLHQGATVQVSEKSLAGQPALNVADGTGATIPDKTVLPVSAVKPPVTLRDILASLDTPTRDSLGGMVRSLGQATDGRMADFQGVMSGLSAVGGNGHTTLDVVASQGQQLRQISRELTTISDALDVGQGQIAQLVSSANDLSGATSGQRANVQAMMRKLPGVLDGADSAASAVSDLSGVLSPVAGDLRRAAPALNDSLDQLPDASNSLRQLLPSLRSVLHEAPDTLHRIPKFGDEARTVFPPATDVLRDLNPALRYIKPYGKDIAQLFASFGAGIHYFGDEGASYIYLRPYFTPDSLRPDPVKFPSTLAPSNPYPAPGSLNDLKPFSGNYPRIDRDGG
jgi:phospholipid/cholesterol/gamma-HCH transport system substrate-binding protein